MTGENNSVLSCGGNDDVYFLNTVCLYIVCINCTHRHVHILNTWIHLVVVRDLSLILAHNYIFILPDHTRIYRMYIWWG